MPLAIQIQETQLTAIDDFTIADVTGTYDALNNTGGYGTPNDSRTDRANYLLVSKNDKAGTRTYLTVANNDPVNNMLWNLKSTEDGWHQATMLSFHRWSGVQNYVINDVQYFSVTNKYYIAIAPSLAIAPDSGLASAYWLEITDFAAIQQGYTNLDVVDYDFLIESRVDTCILDALFDEIDKDFTCKLTIDDLAHPLNLIAMLEGAQAKMITDKPDQAQEIIEKISDCC